MRHRALIVACALAAPGCASLWTAKVAPATRPAEASPPGDSLRASRDVLRERGFAIETEDHAAGLVRTAPAVQAGRVPCGFVTCRFRDTPVEVTVGADASVAVRLKRELSTPGVFGGTSVLLVTERWDEPSIGRRRRSPASRRPRPSCSGRSCGEARARSGCRGASYRLSPELHATKRERGAR